MKSRKPKRPACPHPPLSEAARALLAPVGAARPRRVRQPRAPPPQDLPDPYAGLLTSRQAAELHGVTERTLRNWRRAGLLEVVRGPRARIFYRLEDLLRLLGR
jgi:hypothetical protein